MKQRFGKEEWHKLLTLTKGKRKVVENSITNVRIILENDSDLKGRIRFNEFTLDIERHNVAWCAEDGMFSDHDLANVCEALEAYRSGGFADNRVLKAIQIVAFKNAYHPVRQYLYNLEWDGQPRLRRLFIEHLKADDNETNEKACVCFFMKAIERIMVPGCDCQFMPIFFGGQGCGKSSFVKVLAGEWFNDSEIPVGDKDAYLAIKDSWMIEVAEMDSFYKHEAQTVKKFISSAVDSYRPPYGRGNIKAPRQCVFVGTTNEKRCLTDDTGNRRYWVFEVHATAEDVESRIERLRNDRDQIWAEAMHWYTDRSKEVKPWFREVAVAMDQRQKGYNQKDAIQEELEIYLETAMPNCWPDLLGHDKHEFFHVAPEKRERFVTDRVSCMEYKEEKMQSMCVYNFVCYYLGIDTGAGNYTSMCKKVTRLMDMMPGWVEDPQKHRLEGRGRTFYNRVSCETEKRPDFVPVQQELAFKTSNEPLGVQSGIGYVQHTQPTDDYPFEPPDGEECPF